MDRTISTVRGWPAASKVGTVTSQVVSVGQLTGASVPPKATVIMPSALKSRDPLSTMVWPAAPDEGKTVVIRGLPLAPSGAKPGGVLAAGWLAGDADELDAAVVPDGAPVGDEGAVGRGAFPVVPANLGGGEPLGSVRKNTATATKTRMARAAVARAGAVDGLRSLSRR